MLYLVKRSLMKSPRILSMVRGNGDDPVTNLWTNQTRCDSWEAVQRREPGNPWRHMSTLYGKHDGATVLITGSGPSVARLANVEIPASWVVMSINRSVLIPKRVDYWCACDPDIPGLELQVPASATRVFGIQLYEWMRKKPCVMVEYAGAPLRWSDPAKRPLYWNETTLGWTLHLAIRMGASRIVTLGTDLSTSGQWDGYIQPHGDRPWQQAQHLGVRNRMLDMFTPGEQVQWMERPVWIVDASGGAMPVQKVRLEDAVRV